MKSFSNISHVFVKSTIFIIKSNNNVFRIWYAFVIKIMVSPTIVSDFLGKNGNECRVTELVKLLLTSYQVAGFSATLMIFHIKDQHLVLKEQQVMSYVRLPNAHIYFFFLGVAKFFASCPFLSLDILGFLVGVTLPDFLLSKKSWLSLLLTMRQLLSSLVSTLFSVQRSTYFHLPTFTYRRVGGNLLPHLLVKRIDFKNPT